MLKIIEIAKKSDLRKLGDLVGGKLRNIEENRLYRISHYLRDYRVNDIIYKVPINEEYSYYLIEVEENDEYFKEEIFSLRCIYNFTFTLV